MLRFLSKLVLICNGCFAASVVLRYLEQRNLPATANAVLNPLPFYLQWMVILGVAALLVNLLFLLLSVAMLLARKPLPFAQWLLWTNAGCLLVQIIYYFV